MEIRINRVLSYPAIHHYQETKIGPQVSVFEINNSNIQIYKI